MGRPLATAAPSGYPRPKLLPKYSYPTCTFVILTTVRAAVQSQQRLSVSTSATADGKVFENQLAVLGSKGQGRPERC